MVRHVIEGKNLSHHIRVVLLLFLGDGRGAEELFPFLRKSSEFPYTMSVSLWLHSGVVAEVRTIVRIKANMNTMCEISWIGNATQSRALVVDGIAPLIQIIVVFKLHNQHFLGSIAYRRSWHVWGWIRHSRNLKTKLHILAAGHIYHLFQRNLEGHFAVLALVKSKFITPQDQVSLFVHYALFDFGIALLDDGDSSGSY